MCQGCGNRFYCNSICQKIDWKDNHAKNCFVQISSSPFWNYIYHPLVTRIDKDNVRFDYISYYNLNAVEKQGTNISVSVIDRPWGKPDELNIFGEMTELTHDGKTIPDKSTALVEFHGIMSATLVNGRRNDAVGFLGGTAPKAFVYLIGVDFQDTKNGIFVTLSTAAKKSHIISRSGSLQSYKKAELGEQQKREEWTAEQSQKLLDILEQNDSILLISAGNDPNSIIGNTPESEWMNELVANKRLMRRLLVVGNFRPLAPDKISLDGTFSKIRRLINKYPDPNAKEIDDEIVVRLAKENDILIPHIRATLRKARARYANFEIPFDIHALNQALDKVTEYKHYSNEGAIVSYEAGIMQNHCVFVAGCDIYAMGGYNKLASNDGSSESTPIMAGIFARFIEQHKTPNQSYADMLDMFKKDYTKPMGDAALWGLGGPDIKKMFF